MLKGGCILELRVLLFLRGLTMEMSTPAPLISQLHFKTALSGTPPKKLVRRELEFRLSPINSPSDRALRTGAFAGVMQDESLELCYPRSV
jgi:hypothetical protein